MTDRDTHLQRAQSFGDVAEAYQQARPTYPKHAVEWVLEANLSDTPVGGFSPSRGRVLWAQGDPRADGTFGPYTVRWSLTEEVSRL